MEPESKPTWSTRSDPERGAESGTVSWFDPLWYRRAWVAAAVLVLTSLGWMHFEIGGARATLVFSNVVLTGSAVAATVFLGVLTARSESLDKLGWGLTTAGMGFFATGELSWMLYELGRGGVPYPGVPDFFYLGGYLFVAVGLLAIATTQHRARSALRMSLDGLLVAVALLTISWHFVLEPILAVSDVDSYTMWVSVAYPVLDIVVGSVAFIVAANARGSRRIPITLIASGIFAWAFADSMFAYLSFNDGYVHNEFDTIWLVGYLAVALAAVQLAATMPPATINRSRYELWETIAPYAPFLIAMGVTGYTASVGTLDQVGLGLGVVVLLSLVARQSYIFYDTSVLSGRLERNEAALSRRNEELLLLNRIVRHDIRNDMAVVLGWGEELNARVDADERVMLERMLDTTRHTIELTETLQLFTEAWDTDGEHDLESIPLRTTLLETLARRRETYADVEFVVIGTVPDVDVRASPLLSTVFRNLLNNAVQHNNADEPRIEISADLTEETVTVRISDNGPGIPPAQRDVVFGRGEKGLESDGSGVGLYLVDTLVTQSGGDVWIDSNEVGGAVFTVELQRESTEPDGRERTS
ncbi:sensor histidine kinase [Natronorubrum halophilum]|uniref:sensor histidine kinase n=1 Tax=Natronorubrum halophilum TaxID=1702106 RepID=UPI000EF650E3|nr:HAMP domain-containing sensor histidine kinase [Natronorubrum halophilum]